MPATPRVPLEMKGIEIVTGTGSGSAGPWFKIHVLVAANFSALTITNSTGTLTGIAYPAGTEIYGNITAITLASGTIMAYKRW